MEESYIKIKLPGQTLVLSKGELLTLLRQDVSLWEKALRRGKHELRRKDTGRPPGGGRPPARKQAEGR